MMQRTAADSAVLIGHPQPKGAGVHSRPAEAVLWNGLGVGGRHVIQFGATIVLARALAPEHFGAVAMIVVLTAFTAVFADLGLGVALVQQRGLHQRHLDAAFWMTAGFGALLTAALWVAAPAVARFYDQSVLTSLTRAAAFQFLMSGLAIVPRAVLVRAVRFRAIALIELCTGATAAGVGIVLALTGAGVWSLIGMLLSSAGTSAVLYAAAARWRPRSLAGPGVLAGMASFSGNLVAFRAVNYWARNTDDLLVGRFLGPAALGVYGLAYQLILLPLQQVTAIIGDVMLPVMANCRDDLAQVRLAFVRALQAVALVLFPVMTGLIIVAGEAIPVLFGDQWHGAVPVARILAVAGCFQALGVTVGWIYQSQGRSDAMFRWGVIAAVTVVIGIVAGLRWGVTGVAAGYTIAVVVLTPVSHLIAARLIELRPGELFVTIMPAVAATLGMAALAGGTRAALVYAGLGEPIVLLGAVLTGGVTYFLMLARLRPASLDVLAPLLRPARYRV
jgi:PST family polysaccharide transporter